MPHLSRGDWYLRLALSRPCKSTRRTQRGWTSPRETIDQRSPSSTSAPRSAPSSSSSKFALWFTPTDRAGFDKLRERPPHGLLQLSPTQHGIDSNQSASSRLGRPSSGRRVSSSVMSDTLRFPLADRARHSGDRERASARMPTGGANLKEKRE